MAMVKYILLFVVFFLVTRMVFRVLRVGVRFFKGVEGSRGSGNPSGSGSRGGRIEEADYEVIESHLNDNEGKVRE